MTLHPRFAVADHEDREAIGERAANTPEVLVLPERPVNQSMREESERGQDGDGSKGAKHTYPPELSPRPDEEQQTKATSPEDSKTPSSKGWLHQLGSVSFLSWIPPKLNWKGLRPVLRASVAAWCGLILLLDSRSERALGQAAFLVLIVAIISPASAPVASAIEMNLLQAIFVAISWAWSCLGLYIAHESRHIFKLSQAAFDVLAAAPYAAAGFNSTEITAQIQNDIFHGMYLETTSSAVCGIFLGVGGGFCLWLRGYLGREFTSMPGSASLADTLVQRASLIAGFRIACSIHLPWICSGPATFAIIFSIIMQVISLTIGVLFPYPYYQVGQVFYLPFICQIAINLAVSFLIFPETLAHQFSDRLIATLEPLQSIITQQRDMLKTNPRTSDWLQFKAIKTDVNAAMGGLVLLGASETNLTREVSFARVAGKDLTRILGHMRVLVSRSTGFVAFYEIVEKHLHRSFSDAKGGLAADELVIHLGPSRPTSPGHSPSSTRPPSPSIDQEDRVRDSLDVSGTPRSRSLSRAVSNVSLDDGTHPHETGGVSHAHHESQHKTGNHSKLLKKRPHSRHRGHRTSSHISLPSLLKDVLHPHVDLRPVGVIESLRYADLEDYLHNPRDEEHIEEIIRLLADASDALLVVLDRSIAHLIAVIHKLKSSEATWKAVFVEDIADYERKVKTTMAILADLEGATEEYRKVKRLEVVRPFASLFDPQAPRDDKFVSSTPSHRGLFWAFSYQFSLLGWSEALLEVFREVSKVEKKRRRPRLWTPEWAKFKFGNGEASAAFEDENPTRIPGFFETYSAPRNPDFLPPTKRSQLIGITLYNSFRIFSRSDVLFGVKSAVMMALVSLPAYFSTTSYFFYRERGVWVLIMAALTSTEHVGDTVFGFVIRITGTLAGAVVGLAFWYIGAGKGTGSPFGIAAVALVALPLVLFYRVHFTPPVTAILPAVTSMLVVGYSWQDANQPSASSVGWGWDVAWRRFVCVCIGIFIAFIWAYLPPSATQKESVRRTYAKVIGDTGGVLCQVISFANCKGETPVPAPKTIVSNLQALRAKVSKTTSAKSMVKYELSIRGPWPAAQYQSLQGLQMEVLDLLAQLLGVIASLDEKWVTALLHRAQLSNPRFLGAVLNAFQMVALALESGKAPPMIYNPLLESFMKPREVVMAGHLYGYDLMLDGDAVIEGLPQHVDMDTICSEEYLRFSCGISQCYAIVNRVDRLMLVAKSLCGESYIVYGLQNSGGIQHPEPPEEVRQTWAEANSHRGSTDSLV